MISRCSLILSACFVVSAACAFAQDEQPQRRKRPKAPEAAQSFEKLDKNKDGYLDASELPERLKGRLQRVDQNNDGKVSAEEYKRVAARLGNQAPAQRGQAPAEGALFRLLDADKDGKLSREELEKSLKLFDKLDKNKDGMLDQEELKAAPQKKPGRPGEVITPAAKAERHKDALKTGDLAPDFTLPDLKGTRELTLSSYRGQKPVVLIFASYT
jgi:Ca2+-binding EF-hand superfamily protein